jgi:hypothetical protein
MNDAVFFRVKRMRATKMLFLLLRLSLWLRSSISYLLSACAPFGFWNLLPLAVRRNRRGIREEPTPITTRIFLGVRLAINPLLAD